MRRVMPLLAVLCALGVTSCATGFVSTWKAPDAQRMELAGAKVAAIAMIRDESLRRAAEDALVRELSARGATGVALYTMLPDEKSSDEPAVRAALEQAGFAGAVVMRPVATEKEVVSTPATYVGPSYDRLWGGYHSFGWGRPYPFDYVVGGEIRTNTIVTIETLVYSLRQNKLVWGGTSKTTNPTKVERVIKETSKKVADELQREGLLR